MDAKRVMSTSEPILLVPMTVGRVTILSQFLGHWRALHRSAHNDFWRLPANMRCRTTADGTSTAATLTSTGRCAEDCAAVINADV